MSIKTRDPVCCMKRVGVLLLPLIRNVYLRFLFPLPPPPPPSTRLSRHFAAIHLNPEFYLGVRVGVFGSTRSPFPHVWFTVNFSESEGKICVYFLSLHLLPSLPIDQPPEKFFSLPSNKEERWRLSPSRINHKYQVIARQKHAWRGTFESNVPRPRTKQNELGLHPFMPPRLSRLLAKRHWVPKE